MDLIELGPEDAGEALTLQRAAYVTQAQLHDYPRLPALTETLDELRADLADPAVIALGVREDGRLVGAVRVRRAADEPATADLGRLAVAPDRQGRGIGSLLLEAAEARVPAGVGRIRLFTGEHSGGNLRLYTRHGYRETHRVPASGGHENVFLVKDLPAAPASAAGEPPSRRHTTAGAGGTLPGRRSRAEGPRASSREER